MSNDIDSYNKSQADEDLVICKLLSEEIQNGLPRAESKVWHGHPVWFVDGNPIVGYAKRKVGVTLLFWSGQSFDEPLLKPEGSFKAAEIRYTDEVQIISEDIQRWLEKSVRIQWDYKNIVKRKGILERVENENQ